MAQTKLRCGRIKYTNDLPVYAAFDAGAVTFPGELVGGVPSDLNRAMLAGDLDCGPISSYFYAQHADDFVLLPDVCIGSRRDVRSIYCLSHAAPKDLKDTPIAVTAESATGRALFETICRTHYGFAPVYFESDDPLREYFGRGVPCVVIGDRAIDAYLADPGNAYDLGTLWHGYTGVDMVYAVWAVGRAAADRSPYAAAAVTAALRNALDWGLEHLDAAISMAEKTIPRPAGFYSEYYRALNFRFDAAAQRGLRTFFDACAACGLLVRSPEMAFVNEELERV